MSEWLKGLSRLWICSVLALQWKGPAEPDPDLKRTSGNTSPGVQPRAEVRGVQVQYKCHCYAQNVTAYVRLR